MNGVPATTSSLDPATRPNRPIFGCALKLVIARSIRSTIERATRGLFAAMKL
jgi:hypothetical protein